MSDIKNTTKLIGLEKKKVNLLIELNQSLKEENAKIIVDNIITDNKRLFIAIDSSTNKQIYNGSEEDVMGFLAKNRYTEIYWRTLKRK